MSFLKVLEQSGIIQILRGSLRTEEDREAFDKNLEEQIKYYSVMYEDLNAKVMQYNSVVEKLNVENTEHRQRESVDHSES